MEQGSSTGPTLNGIYRSYKTSDIENFNTALQSSLDEIKTQIVNLKKHSKAAC